MSMAEQTTVPDHSWTQSSAATATRPSKPSRRLKPEVVAKLKTRRSEAPLQDLYQKPVTELSPQELAMMREAFFRG